MMDSVYIETTVVSYLTARTKPGTLSDQWRLWTEDLWRLRRPVFRCFISGEVLREAARGDSEAAGRRMAVLRELPLLAPHRETLVLAEKFLSEGGLPAKAGPDALHLAFATWYGMEYLLTWNMNHLANAALWPKLRMIAQERGLRFPIVCPPIQLMGDIRYER
jgi:predicted nucleic acid-binding protein